MRSSTKPPVLDALLGTLVDADLRFVVVGSAATLFHGGHVQPGDLDIVPCLERQNLTLLAGVLQNLNATVPNVDRVCKWERSLDGEWIWLHREATEEERKALLNWVPNPDHPSDFDHLFHTRLGNLDVLPAIAGEFCDLVRRAVQIEYSGTQVLVAHATDLLATLTVPRRTKDRERVQFLRALQRQRA